MKSQGARKTSIEQGIEMRKSQIEEVKKRREMKKDAVEKKKILWTFKWPLIKYVREKRLQEKMIELDRQRMVRAWSIRIKVPQIYQLIYKKFRQAIAEAQVTKEQRRAQAE